VIFYMPVTLEELRNLSDEEVVKRINDKIAPEIGTSFFSLPDFVSAQFYLAELDRREKSRADDKRDGIETKRWKTDLKYERWIVFLIIFEVIAAALLTLWADHRQSKSSDRELAVLQSMQVVLSHLQESSAATAGTLVALQETSKQMNEAVQNELSLSYEASLNVSYNIVTETVSITNEGRSNITLWGSKIGNGRTISEKPPRALTPGVPYALPAHEIVSGLLQQRNPEAKNGPISFVMLLKNERGEELVGEYLLSGNSGGPLQVGTVMVSMKLVRWSKKTQ
jgi:hypothetical protein